ncbi:MAG TPA: hypothetical protein VGH57_03830 [Amycolatopsis sp.]
MAGVDDLAASLNAIAVRLRELGDEGLVSELQREIGGAVAPLPARIRAGLPAYLPDRYAGVLDADLSVSRRTFTGGAGGEARVSVYASARVKKRKLRQSDAGFLWHPVFGDRTDWRVNEAPGHGMEPGWFSRPVEEAVPQVRDAVERALDNVVAKAVRKGL